jgi:hypothetical protein
MSGEGTGIGKIARDAPIIVTQTELLPKGQQLVAEPDATYDFVGPKPNNVRRETSEVQQFADRIVVGAQNRPMVFAEGPSAPVGGVSDKHEWFGTAYGRGFEAGRGLANELSRGSDPTDAQRSEVKKNIEEMAAKFGDPHDRADFLAGLSLGSIQVANYELFHGDRLAYERASLPADLAMALKVNQSEKPLDPNERANIDKWFREQMAGIPDATKTPIWIANRIVNEAFRPDGPLGTGNPLTPAGQKYVMDKVRDELKGKPPSFFNEMGRWLFLWSLKGYQSRIGSPERKQHADNLAVAAARITGDLIALNDWPADEANLARASLLLHRDTAAMLTAAKK